MNGLAVVTVAALTVSAKGPDAVPDGTMNETDPLSALEASCVSVPPPCFETVICAAVFGFGWRFVPVKVTSVPTGPLFGLKSVRTGELFAVTVNPLGALATSAPVETVTVLEPAAALPRIEMSTEAWVASVIFRLVTVIPAPKLATLAPCRKLE